MLWLLEKTLDPNRKSHTRKVELTGQYDHVTNRSGRNIRKAKNLLRQYELTVSRKHSEIEALLLS